MGEEEESTEQRRSLTNSNEGSSVGRAVEVLSSLISLSCSVKVFSVKWQLIRNKLEDLISVLCAIEDCDSSFGPSLSSLVLAILATADECSDLARRCVDLSYSGKLLMQSDLDMLSSKFDFHARSLSGIYSSGILSHGCAIVVSRPSPGACREDMSFYVKDLLTRMKIGDADMKKQALSNLREAVLEDEKYVKLVFEIDDFVHVLVGLIDSTEAGVQEEAASITALILRFDSYKHVLIQSGLVGPLVRVLENGSDMGRLASARCLMKLTENSDNAWSVSAHGGVTVLLKLCSDGNSKQELIVHACGVLRNLVGVEEVKTFMVEEGAISTFIHLAKSNDEIVQISSMDFLQSTAWNDEQTRQIIIEGGGLQVLLRVLAPQSSSSPKSKEIALRAIENICFSSISNVNTLLSHDFMGYLRVLLRNQEVSVQESALKVVFRLCCISEEAKKAMGDSGFMTELANFLHAKHVNVREMASEALYNLILVPRNRKRFAQDDRSIGNVLRLLDQEDKQSSVVRKSLISLLICVTRCNSARRKILSSGYLKSIEKLAEAEVSDAKRLVRKLSTNRFLSALSGIWHS